MAVKKQVTYQELLQLAADSEEGKRNLGDEGPRQPVEMFENERYRPGIGWSGGYLLATERSTFSNRQGRLGAYTFNACAQKLSVEDSSGWQLDRHWMDVDDDGWQYANDFGKFEGHLKEGRSNSKPKTMHFVRRRRWIYGVMSTSYAKERIVDEITQEMIMMEEKLRQSRRQEEVKWENTKPTRYETIKKITKAYKIAQIEQDKISAQFKAYRKLEKKRGQKWVPANAKETVDAIPEARMEQDQKEALKARLEFLEQELVLLKARQLGKQIDNMFSPTKHDNMRIPVEGANIRIGEVWVESIQGKVNLSVVNGDHKLCVNKDGNPEFRCELRGPSDYVRDDEMEAMESDSDDDDDDQSAEPTTGVGGGIVGSVRDNASRIRAKVRGSVRQGGKMAGTAMKLGAGKMVDAALVPSRAVQHVMVGSAHSKYGAGICIKVLLVDFELAGEPGTGIPNLKFDRIQLELEVFARMSAVFDKSRGKWVPGKDFKLKLVRFRGPSSLIVWAGKRILGLVKPMIKTLVAQALPVELGHLAAVKDGFEIETVADFNIVGNQNADDLVADLVSEAATSCLRFGGSARRVSAGLKQFHKLVKVLPPKMKMPPLKTVVELIRYVMDRRDSVDWPKIVNAWEALALAASADPKIHFKLTGREEAELPYRNLFERARIMGLKPIKLNVRLGKLEVKLSALPALEHGQALALRLIESGHTKNEKMTDKITNKASVSTTKADVLVLANSGKDLEPKLEAIKGLCTFLKDVLVEVTKNLKKLQVKVGVQLQGGASEVGQIGIYINDLMYDGPLRNMLMLGGATIPRVQSQSEFSLFGYDQFLTSRRRGLYSWAIHFAQEAWRRKVTIVGGEHKSWSGVLCGPAPTDPEGIPKFEDAAVYEIKLETGSFAHIRGDELQFAVAAIEEAKQEAAAVVLEAGATREEEEGERNSQEEADDPTIEPIIELLFSRIDIEIYADAPPPGVRLTESFTQNNSSWRREDKMRSKTLHEAKAFRSE
jgi:hypothetical protein